MNSLFNFIHKVTHLGVLADSNDADRRILFSNVVFICLPLVYVIFMVLDYESYMTAIQELRFDQLVVPIIIGICILGLWLNKQNFTTLSRILFLGLWPLLLHLIPIRLLNTPSDYYLAYPFGIVFYSILIQLMFSYRNEALLYWCFMIINLVGVITFPSVLVYFDLDHDVPHDMINYKYYFYDGVLYWLLFNLVTFYILFVNESYIKKINKTKALIEEQKFALNSVNQNLEKIVSERTLQLQEQNEKLKQHAFFNAHMLRGPFCRIKGLVQLQDLTLKNDEVFELRSKLNESIEELDMRIFEIQKLVETENN